MACAVALCVAASCSGSRAADPASRFFAVHNVMLAIGLYQTGPVNQGTLAAGQEVRLPLTLPGYLRCGGGDGRSGRFAICRSGWSIPTATWSPRRQLTRPKRWCARVSIAPANTLRCSA